MALQEHSILSPIDEIKESFNSVKTGSPSERPESFSKSEEPKLPERAQEKKELVILPNLGKDELPKQKNKKKKCDDEECKRRVPLDQEFCDEHRPPDPPTPEQVNSGKIALFNLHLSVYLLAEMVSNAYQSPNFDLNGMTNLLLSQKEQIEEIHGNLIEYYGMENIEALCNPLVSLTAITTGHVIMTVKENSKKNFSIEQQKN